MKEKIEETIHYIQEHSPPEGYYLGFSGGKDSIVLYDIALKSKVPFQAYYSCTGIDPPEITRFIRKHYPTVTFLFPKRHFFKEMEKKGIPMRMQRWCCNFLKKDPGKKIPLPYRLMGIRKEESFRRASRPKIDYHKSYKQLIVKPIFDWLEWEIWEYIEKNKLPSSELYDDFNRLGCVVCPFVTGKKQELHKSKWPKIYAYFELAFAKTWEKKKFDKRFDMPWEKAIEKWYAGKSFGDNGNTSVNKT